MRIRTTIERTDACPRSGGLHRRTSTFLSGTVTCLAVAGALLPPAPSKAQDSARVVSWEPATPVQGTLFRVVVNGLAQDVVSATGSAAGEPLHFERAQDGRLSALAAAPLDGGAKLDLLVEVKRADGSSEPVRVDVPVAAGSYALDRLSVAPQFGAPPDAATCRIRIPTSLHPSPAHGLGTSAPCRPNRSPEGTDPPRLAGDTAPQVRRRQGDHRCSQSRRSNRVALGTQAQA